MTTDQRTTIITGAASGIGHACAVRQGARGEHVVAWDIDAAAAQATADEITAAGGSAEALGLDLGDVPATRAAVEDVARRRSPLTGLVNAAGVMRTIPFADIDEAEYERLMRVNLQGAFFLVQTAAALMEDGGSIVLLASVAARKGRPLAAHYAASKAATVSLTQSAAMACGPAVRVNALCPGVIATDMMRQIARERHELLGSAVDDPYPGIEATLALRRIGEPDDVAKVAEFLLGPLSAYVTGQSINVDGGLEFH